MKNFEVGDLVKGLPGSNAYYSITNEDMTKGVVLDKMGYYSSVIKP